MNTYIQKKIANMKLTLSEMSGGYKRMVTSMKKLGFSGTLKLIWDDLFAHRSLGQWVYLLILGSFPLWLELIYEHRIVDWTGMICSLTGIICVIFVSEGRALWRGPDDSLLYHHAANWTLGVDLSRSV